MSTAEKQYTHLEMEAALCVWEEINERTLNPDEEYSRGEKLWIELREGLGSAEMRHQSIVIGKWCLAIYDILTKNDRYFFDCVAYDFEVIPMFLDYAEKDGAPAIYEKDLPDPHGVAQLVAHRHIHNEYVRKCRQEALQQWRFESLISENEEDAYRAFVNGDDPKDFVRELGKDLDLIDFGPWG